MKKPGPRKKKQERRVKATEKKRRRGLDLLPVLRPLVRAVGHEEVLMLLGHCLRSIAEDSLRGSDSKAESLILQRSGIELHFKPKRLGDQVVAESVRRTWSLVDRSEQEPGETGKILRLGPTNFN